MKDSRLTRLSLFTILFLILLGTYSCNSKLTENDFKEFINEFENEYIPLNNSIQNAEYNAATSGSEEDYNEATKLNIELTEFLANSSNFKKIKKFKKSKEIKDPVLKKEIEILYNQLLFHQLKTDEMAEIVTDAQKLTKKFSNYRTKVGQKYISDNKVEEILSNTLDSKMLEDVWKASKMVGNEVSSDMISLVKKRNSAAQGLGFKNYFEMRLIVAGQDPIELEEIYSGFNILTEGIYDDMKTQMDEKLSIIYSVPSEQLMPWHYQDRFFQKAPNIYNVDLDKFYKGINQIEIVEKFFSGLGLETKGFLNNSDLFERPGKIQSASSFDINRKGDVRIVMNLSENEYSMNTLLYETAFSLFHKNVSRDLPYLLREPSHFCINDAIAIMFSQFSSDPAWLKEVVGISNEEKEIICSQNAKYLALSKIVFSRWAQVMYNFEKEMYSNPDQDLNKLWWQLVKKYQKINKPKNWNNPDWAVKNHIITMPCTYHNYILGELFAAQLMFYIKDKITKHDKCEVKCINNPEVGKFLIDKVFRPGKSLSWEELIEYSTGQELDPDYFKKACLQIAATEN